MSGKMEMKGKFFLEGLDLGELFLRFLSLFSFSIE